MLKLSSSILPALLVFSAMSCGSTETPDAGTGGRGGSSAGGTGGATGGSGGSGAAGQGDSGACAKFDYTNYNPTMSPTLKNDIQPILGISCALSTSCHQTSTSGKHPQLGPSTFQLDGGKPPDAVLVAIIEELKKPSAQVGGRNVAVPGKPEDSYLMNKLENTNNCSGFVCMGPDKCGDYMPAGSPLDKTQLELFRAWIKKGMQM
jgi:hypothetical protein